MRAYEFLIREDQQLPVSELEKLKLQLAGKIKQLPNDPETMNLLKEVEDILSDVGALTSQNYINAQLQAIDDKEVQQGHKLLARYILGAAPSKRELTDLFAAWREDQLIDHDLLISTGTHSIEEIIPWYTKNKTIKTIVDDLINIESHGRGKGEFLLTVFSRAISKPPKGDLDVSGRIYELKTKSTKAGYKFYDRAMVPKRPYHLACENFENIFADELASRKIAQTGINIATFVDIGAKTDKKQEFAEAAQAIISNLFNKVPEHAGAVLDFVLAGRTKSSVKAWGNACFAQYLATKQFSGMIVLDSTQEGLYTFTTFSNLEDLEKLGLAFWFDTAYPVTNDPTNAIPQSKLVDAGSAISSAGEISPRSASVASAKPAPRGRPTATKPVNARQGFWSKYDKTMMDKIRTSPNVNQNQLRTDFDNMSLPDFEKKYVEPVLQPKLI